MKFATAFAGAVLTLTALADGKDIEKRSDHTKLRRGFGHTPPGGWKTPIPLPTLHKLGLLGHDYFMKNGLYFTVLPNWSVNETIWELNDLMDTKFSAWGEYAQVFPGELWDPTAQIYAKIENMKKSNAILQLSLMPVAGFWGMSEGDNAQAVQIAKHCANLTRTLGKPVWLRYAHEINWYMSEDAGWIYNGTIAEYKEAWRVLSHALDRYSPTTLMWWNPNVAESLEDYEAYYPDQGGRVDIVGVDWYPTSMPSSPTAYADKLKEFAKRFASARVPYFAGEIGTQFQGTEEERITWIRYMTSKETVATIPHYLGVSYFNYFQTIDWDMRVMVLPKEEDAGGGKTNAQLMNNYTYTWIHEDDPEKHHNGKFGIHLDIKLDIHGLSL